MTSHFPCSPPRKRAKSEFRRVSADDFPDSDDSFDDPVLDEPSLITQTILQRRQANQQNTGTQHQGKENGVASMPIHVSPLRAPHELDSRRKPVQRMSASVTPRRFNTQEKNDYHHNGQLLMLKNRLENMEREKERLAAMTRDQLIAKEKHHEAELNEKEERIRQLETQVQCLRQENLQTSFQVHNMTISESVDVEMADVGTSAARSLLPTKRVSLPRSDVAWKNVPRFGAAASVFANNSTIARFGNENGSETFTHIPSQMLVNPSVSNNAFRFPQPSYAAPALPKKVVVPTESKQCQVDGVSDDWNVHSVMREAPLESLLGSSSVSEENNFDLPVLIRLCQVRDHVELKGCLRAVGPDPNDSFS